MMSSAFELSPESNSKNLAFVLKDFLFGCFAGLDFSKQFKCFVPTGDDHAN